MAIQAIKSIARWPSTIWINLLLGIGILLRVYLYLLNRALWLDEAMLANNLLDRGFAGLAQPLADNQSAPLGQLWLTKLLTLGLGYSEYVLRLPALVAGLLALFLFLRLARKLFFGKWVLWALAFFVFCDPHIYYSSEFKQYAFDVVITLAITLATLPLFQRRWLPAQLGRLGLLGLIAPWFSQPAIFVLVGAGLGLLAFHYFDWKRLGRIAAWGLGWLLSFGGYYWLLLAHNIDNSQLQTYHSDYFLPLTFWQLESWQWYGWTYFRLFRDSGGLLFQYLAGAIGLLGFTTMNRWWRSHWLLLFGPLVLAIGASGLQLYSTLPRLLLFAAPTVLIALVKGGRRIEDWMEERWPSVWPRRLLMLSMALLLLQPILNGLQRFTTDQGVEEIREPLRWIKAQRQAGDVLYLYPAARPAFDYYTVRWGGQNGKIWKGVSPWEDWPEDLRQLAQFDRVWLLFAHDKREGALDQERYKAALRENGRIVKELRVRGSGCLLYVPNQSDAIRLQ
ncbi:MAG: hypothetical protein AAGG75_00990 [Bacteroidota bacterium]